MSLSRFNTSVFTQNCSEGNQNDCKEYGEKIDTTNKKQDIARSHM